MGKPGIPTRPKLRKSKPYDNAGAQLIYLRKKLKLTQVELGKKIGASSQIVSNCERGLAYLSVPQIEKLQKLNSLETSVYLDKFVEDKTEHAQQIRKAILKKLR